MAETVRVRFAPSPTGHLHVGGARTALYNYLHARRMGGVFVLRIEDTDVVRSTRESYDGILRGMKWLGLDWDEGPDVGGDYGPYVQSARSVLYHSESKRLLDEGKAYYCFCTPEELEAMKLEAQEKKLPPKYDGRCRRLEPAEIRKRLSDGLPHVIRFKMPYEGEVRFRDIVRGDFAFSNAELDDFVLIKSDESPTYNFAVVVDDAHMKITHVIRGDDHISNTPRQVHLYIGLGYSLPKFAHLPMILGRDRARLSKRHGATSVDFYRDNYYLPDAIINYLALLGWSLDGKRELFSKKALIEHFSLKKVSRNPAMFDTDKMEWINAEHFKKLSLMEKTWLVYELLDREGYLPPDFDVDLSKRVDLEVVAGTEPLIERKPKPEGAFNERSFNRIAFIVYILGNRLKLLKDVPDLVGYFIKDDYKRDEAAVKAHLTSRLAAERLSALADELENVRFFAYDSVEEAVRGLADRMNIQAGELIHPCRVALTGKTVSPDIFQVIIGLGKAKAIERLRNAASAAS
jgi:nondiscriminating glutamyl-tRNA synthetase